jgi:NTE family protein
LDSRKAETPPRGGPRIGLALGGGAAHGFAHIPVLEAFDELGLRPAMITGTSMGAVIGAAYASGMSGAEIRDYALSVFHRRSEVLTRLWQVRPRRFSEISFGFGQFDLERVLAAFMPGTMAKAFSDLGLPFRAVATDYYAGHQVVLSEGPLFPAVAASSAVPMLFKPVRIGGRILIDGGITNPVPFDLLEAVDIVVAVDVMTEPVGPPERMPGGIESLFGATSLIMRSMVLEKLRACRPPEIFIRPPALGGVNVLDFSRAARIIKASEPVKAELKARLEGVLNAVDRGATILPRAAGEPGGVESGIA